MSSFNGIAGGGGIGGISGGGSGSSGNLAAVPLLDIVPWSIDNPRTLLVQDSIETDGRFLLHTLAAQVFASSHASGKSINSAASYKAHLADNVNNNSNNELTLPEQQPRILWLSCGGWTETLIINSLKKMIRNSGSSNSAEIISSISKQESKQQQQPQHKKLNSILTIRCILEEVTNEILLSPTSNEIGFDEEKGGSNGNNNQFNSEKFLKRMCREIKTWARSDTADSTSFAQKDQNRGEGGTLSWIILDDVSALASLFGERLVYQFVLSLTEITKTTLHTNQQRDPSVVGLLMLCSNDYDKEEEEMLYNESSGNNSSTKGKPPDRFGAGVAVYTDDDFIPWERGLVELVDCVVDVISLPSGYTREAQGRLVFTECAHGRGWGPLNRPNTNVTNTNVGNKQSKLKIVNYCITDNSKILATPIQTPSLAI